MSSRESIPEQSGLDALASALRELPEVAAVDAIPPAEDPSGYATLEITVAPAHLDDRGRVPAAVGRTVFDAEAPWDCGIVDVSRRMVDIQTICIR